MEYPREAARSGQWPRAFLRTCVPVEEESFPTGRVSGVVGAQVSPHNVELQVQALQKLERLLAASQQTTHEVKCLQQQVDTLQASIQQHNPRDVETSKSKLSDRKLAAPISSNDQVDLFSEETSVMLDTSREEFHALRQQVTALEMSLHRHLAKQRSDVAGDAAGSALSFKSVIAGLESQLELRLAAMHEMDAEVLRCCKDCNARCERVESMLNGATSRKAKCHVHKAAKAAPLDGASTTLLKNVETLDADVTQDGAENSITPAAIRLSVNLQQHRETVRINMIADSVGAGTRGWLSRVSDGDQRRLAILRFLDWTAFALVVVDIAMVGIIAHIDIRHALSGTSSPGWIYFSQLALALGFVAELTARKWTQGSQFFRGVNGRWNIIDVLVTIVSLVDAILGLANGAGSLAHLTFFRVLRLMRLVRIAKLFHKLHSLHEFGLIMECIVGAALPISWVFLLLGFFLYLSTVVLLQLLEPSIRIGIKVDNGDLARLYGGLGRSMNTLLLAVSGGMPWDELAQPLIRQSGWFHLFFVVYICIVSFFALNLLSAVFVTFVTKFDRKLHDQELRDCQAQNLHFAEDLRQLLHDRNPRADGIISRRRLEKILSEQGRDSLDKLDLNIETALGIFKMIEHGKGSANIDELICSWVQLKGNPSNIHIVSMMYETKRIISRINALSELVQVSLVAVNDEKDMMPAAVETAVL